MGVVLECDQKEVDCDAAITGETYKRKYQLYFFVSEPDIFGSSDYFQPVLVAINIVCSNRSSDRCGYFRNFQKFPTCVGIRVGVGYFWKF